MYEILLMIKTGTGNLLNENTKEKENNLCYHQQKKKQLARFF